MKSITSYIGSQFAKPTGWGGKLSTIVMNIMNKGQYKAVLRTVGNADSAKKILDIGFGNGNLIKKLTKHSEAEFYGIDISEDLLSNALYRNRKQVKKGKVRLQTAGINSLPYENSFFDAIYTVNTIYFWEDITVGLAEIKRVLKPEGIFINVAYTKRWLDKLPYTRYGFSKYEIEELKQRIKLSGLELVCIINLRSDVSYSMVIKKKSEN